MKTTIQILALTLAIAVGALNGKANLGVAARESQTRPLRLRGQEETRKVRRPARRKLIEGDPYPAEGCSVLETKVRVDLLTDNYGEDNSWELRKTDENGDLMMQSDRQYGFKESDVQEKCIMQGNYEFIFRDSYGDGLCCNSGQGHIRLEIWQEQEGTWLNIAEETQFTERELSWNFFAEAPTANPTSRPTLQPTIRGPTPAPQPLSPAPTVDDCNNEFVGLRCFKVEIKNDRYGEDISWEFRNAAGDVLLENDRGYTQDEMDSREVCIPRNAMYEFQMNDSYGDGMCCAYGDGFYKLHVKEDYQGEDEWEQIVHGGFAKNQNTMVHLLNTTEPLLTTRDCDWLKSHNTRREKYHVQFNHSYVPLKWSEGLKSDAEVWATHLLGNCGHDMYHDPNRIHGENVAANSGGGTWGSLKTVEQVMTRFVENELTWKYPANTHLTQVLWRATKYVGCGEAEGPYGTNGMCRVQVCRYALQGNMGVGSFDNGQDEYWWDAVMNDDPPKGGYDSLCPSDGCR